MAEKPPPIVIPRGKLLPKQRAPIIPTRVVQDKRRKVGRKAKHKKQVSGVRRQVSGVRRQVSGVRRQASGVRCQVSGED